MQVKPTYPMPIRLNEQQRLTAIEVLKKTEYSYSKIFHVGLLLIKKMPCVAEKLLKQEEGKWPEKKAGKSKQKTTT